MPERAPYRKESDEIYYVTDLFPVVGLSDVNFLKARAAENSRLRCRLCVHPSVDDRLHEMVIVFHRDTYFRPLRHRERPQSFQIVEGNVTIAILDDGGEILRLIDIAATDPDRGFKTRIPPDHWYAFMIDSEWLVLQEITTGPMNYSEREYAPFAPQEGDAAGPLYAENLRRQAARFAGVRDV
jgi:cupin fold WbuC family metalloprotein